MTLLTIPLIAAVAWGQVFATPTSVASSSPANFAASFDSLYKDFGTVPHGSQSVHRFKFTNRSDRDVHVQSVSSSCRCAIPRAVSDHAKPGETIDIEVVYDAKTFVNERSMTITVDLRPEGSYSQYVQLKVRGFSRQDV